MAQLMTDEQREATLQAYDPRAHLISVGTNKDKSPVLYYPAAWRLYELRLRHPHFVLEAEIVHMDEEKGTVIVKAIGYDGLDYASSFLKGTAFKQGKITELDKVETKAMSRVARNIGIGTEYALDMEPNETDATHGTPTTSNGNGKAPSVSSQAQSDALTELIGKAKTRAKTMSLVTDKATWEAFLQECTGEPLTDKEITLALIARVNGKLTQIERERTSAANGGGQ